MLGLGQILMISSLRKKCSRQRVKCLLYLTILRTALNTRAHFFKTEKSVKAGPEERHSWRSGCAGGGIRWNELVIPEVSCVRFGSSGLCAHVLVKQDKLGIP